VYGCLPLNGAIAGQIVVGREHRSHADYPDSMVAQEVERLVSIVPQVWAVMVAVQLDVADAGAPEACR
jgi:hypothetical protein